MTLYEKNIHTLAKYYPKMDRLIENGKKNLKKELEIYEEKSEDGNVILKIAKRDKICYLNGKRNTMEPAQMWVKTLGELQTNAPIFLMGVGNFFYLKELVERTQKRITIIVYEPSLQIFLKFLELVDLEEWMEKHLIIFWVNGLEGMDSKHMRSIIEGVLKYEMLPYSRYLILPNYDVLFVEEAVEFVKLCRDIAHEEVAGFNTKMIFSNVMVKNLLSNAPYLCKGYKTTQLIDAIPRDIPGIVVAAGPSLNKNVKELRKAKGKSFIIAVDTAIKPMLQAGVKPDMIAIIDALKPVELVKIAGAEQIPLVTTLNAASEVLQYHMGMKFFFNEGYQFAERIFLKSGQKIGDVSTGGSVATSAFSLLYKIGIDRIILVGQDLAYTNNKSHADGTFQEIMEEQDTSNFIMVEGNYQEKVPIAGDLKIFLDWYNMYIEGCKKHRKNFCVINATEGGAKISNTEIMSLKDAIERECTKEVDIQACLEKLPPMLSKENQEWALEFLHSFPEEFQKLSFEARKLKGMYQKLDKVCNKRHIDSKEYLSVLKKIEKQISNIERRDSYQLVTITLSEAKSILKNEQFLQEDSLNEEGKEIARKGILYMEMVDQCSLLFKEYVEEIYKNI